MKNILAKFFIYSFIILLLIIFYLSFFGISTSKFNKSIKDSFLKNNEILLVNINEIKIKLYPFKLTTKLTTKDVEIKINSRLIKLNEVRSEISSIINPSTHNPILQIYARIAEIIKIKKEIVSKVSFIY